MQGDFEKAIEEAEKRGPNEALKNLMQGDEIDRKSALRARWPDVIAQIEAAAEARGYERGLKDGLAQGKEK